MYLREEMFVYVWNKLRYLVQKVTHGFSEPDLWDLNITFAQFILPRLTAFRGHFTECPKEFLPFYGTVYLTEEQIARGKEEFEIILDKMINAFELILIESESHEIADGLELFARYFNILRY